MASRLIGDLCPELRSKAVEFCARAKTRGIDVLIYCTYRPQKEQDDLYEQGRSRPGTIVTWTRKSKHGVVDSLGKPASEAWDCVPLLSGKPSWDARGLYLQLAQIAKEIGGLRWGGDWDGDGKPFERGEYDSPHFELVR